MVLVLLVTSSVAHAASATFTKSFQAGIDAYRLGKYDDARKHLEGAEKGGVISRDDLDRAEKELEKVTHDHVERIDKAFGRKESELLEV